MEISAKDVHVYYDETYALKGVDVCINKANITTIIGPNGSGKSTLLKSITRLLKAKRGKVLLNGHEIYNMRNKDVSKIIGVLPQRHSAPPDFKVHELVGYGRLPHKKAFEKLNDVDLKIIDEVMHLTRITKLKDKSVNEISGGESQRVWLATVLAQKPEILFLDEPTTYLDVSSQLDLMKMVYNLNRESSLGVVMVLHDINHAIEVSDHIIIMKDGKKYDEGAPNDVITKEMMMDIYNVDCEIVYLNNRKRPIILYNEIVA